MEMVHFIPTSQRRLVMLAAQADLAPVLICGSMGTGKGAISRWIQKNGPRSAQPYISASRDNSIPLMEQIPKAQGGTFVIPEIGQYPLGEQKLLLQFLDTKSIPHPKEKGMKMLLNVRIIATSSQVLEGRAQAGLFNQELLKKLNVYRVEMPDLYKRQDEFEDIVKGILAEITNELHKEYVKELSPEAWEKLKSYKWPGNLRELRNVLRVSVISATGDKITLENLPDFGPGRVDFHATREKFEKTYILELLKTFDWKIDKTCQVSRIDKAALMSKIKKYGIDTEKPVSIR